MELDIFANQSATIEADPSETAPSLIFRVENTFYALPVSDVREIHLLPALIALDQAPPQIIGLLNLRGEVIAVMDLARRLGRLPQPVALDDRLLILEIESQKLGLRVSEVLQIGPIAPALRQALPEAVRTEMALHHSLFEGVARVGEHIVLLLNAARLSAPLPSTESFDDIEFLSEATAIHSGFALHLSPDARAVFEARATRLRQNQLQHSEVGLSPVAMVRLGAEQFGIALEGVHEFCTLRAPTPVPCCPPHILGQMNLRGELLTLVDVRHLLGVTQAEVRENPLKTPVVVVQHDGFLTGIVVDEVVDVLMLPFETSGLEGEARGSVSPHSKYLQGGALHENRMLYLLDLQKILHEADLGVNQQV